MVKATHHASASRPWDQAVKSVIRPNRETSPSRDQLRVAGTDPQRCGVIRLAAGSHSVPAAEASIASLLSASASPFSLRGIQV